MRVDAPITQLKGIGPKSAEKFYRIGIRTVGDLVGFYPRTYDSLQPPIEIKDAADGQIVAVCGFITKTLSVRRLPHLQIVTGKIHTPGGEMSVSWFNMPYLRSTVQPGKQYVFRGYARQKGRQLALTQPRLYDPEEYKLLCEKLQPVYPLTAGLTEHALRKAIGQALDGLDLSRDYLPEEIRGRYELAQYDYALRQIHYPEDMHHCVTARKRLVFDEFLLFILGLKRMREERAGQSSCFVMSSFDLAEQVIAHLPYRLTGAQEKVWDAVAKDLSGGGVMSRLIQGDVGSGKTVIAFLALVTAAQHQTQGALMVPTEVLARQHYEAFTRLMERSGLPVRAALLTGSLSAKEKRETARRIEDGEVSVIIGTHALIQEKVTYRRLSLVITDEQHRFGVKQREALSVKGEEPHILVMSATPIPRTLAVILYGDLDVSVIDELPVGRKPVKNCVVDTSWRPKAYAFLKREALAGHQAYVICPMVEESEQIEAENVIDYAQTLRAGLGDGVTVEYLHGRMKAKEKNEIMQRFVAGEIQILVSTTVIEVGVNVPNATVMMIEDAQRFGLAQLHQLRGRVGRGEDQAYCIMVNSSGKEETNRRLEIMNQSNDGFEIARKDLELRGPGDLFGIRQSGLIDFKIADVFNDASVMQSASEAAGMILQEDYELKSEKYRELREKLLSYTSGVPGNVNI